MSATSQSPAAQPGLVVRRSQGMRSRVAIACALGTLTLALAGCKGVPVKSEQQAREKVRQVSRLYRPEGQAPALPLLSTNSALADFIRYSMLRRPEVEVAYYAWLASVDRITIERSLPDPRLGFEVDIKDIVETAMPGLMMDFPGPGKLKARGAVASAESEVKYYAFERSVLEAAFAVKRAYYQLGLLLGQIRINRETLTLLDDLETIARRQHEAGLVTMTDVLRAQIEQDRLRTEILNMEDSLASTLAQFGKALGMKEHEAGPPIPARFEVDAIEIPPEKLLQTAFERNPGLKAMESEVRQAEAAIRLANRSKVPDFSAGVEVDALASPVMVRPSLGATLPIWRDKIAAQIAAAQAEKRAAEARLGAEQVNLAVEVAERSYVFREATRSLQLYQKSLVPKARLSLDAARAGYLSGKVDFLNLIDAWRTLLGFELNTLETQTRRELALVELVLIAGQRPPGAPLPISSESAVAEDGTKSQGK